MKAEMVLKNGKNGDATYCALEVTIDGQHFTLQMPQHEYIKLQSGGMLGDKMPSFPYQIDPVNFFVRLAEKINLAK